MSDFDRYFDRIPKKAVTINGVTQLDLTQIEDMEIKELEPSVVGITFGDVGLSEFQICVVRKLEKSDYVVVQHPEYGTVLGQVSDIIRKSDLTLEKCHERKPGTKIEEMLVGHVNVIGYRNESGVLTIPKTPLPIDAEVRIASPEDVKSILKLRDSVSTSAKIGLLKGFDVPVMLDINMLVQRNTCVLAKTGGGKSYISGDIVEELIDHGITCVIIDPRGEYASMRNPSEHPDDRFDISPKGYADKILEFGLIGSPDMLPLRFTFRSLKTTDMEELLTSAGSRMNFHALVEAMDLVSQTKDYYSIDDVIDRLSHDPIKNASLIDDLKSLDSMHLFVEKGNHISELIEKGKTTILNLKGIPATVQELIVRRWSTMLFEMRKVERIPPLMMVVEDAHLYCPENEDPSCKDILETIASEGRKINLGLLVVSQRPAKLDAKVLAQCGTQIILNITNPLDLKTITTSIEDLTGSMERDIQTIPVGTAIVSGSGLPTPLFVEVRPRKSQHSNDTAILE